MRESTFTHGAPAVSPDAATTAGTRWGATPSRRSNATSEPSANVTDCDPIAVAWRSRRNSIARELQLELERPAAGPSDDRQAHRQRAEHGHLGRHPALLEALPQQQRELERGRRARIGRSEDPDDHPSAGDVPRSPRDHGRNSSRS